MKKSKPLDASEAAGIYRLFRLIQDTGDAVTRCRDVELRKYSITPEQAAALVCIHSIGKKATPAKVSRWIFREANSVSVLLRRMENSGLIKKTTDIQNKRSTRLSLTKKGYEAYKHAIEFHAFYDIISVLPEDKRQQLCSILETLRSKAFDRLGLDIASYSRLFEEELKLDIGDSDTKRPEQKDSF